MFHETCHVSWKNFETNPRISPRKIIRATEFCPSCYVSDRDDVIDFHMNYEQVPTADAKSKDQTNSLKHDEQSETLSLSLMKRKIIIKKLIFNKRIYLKRIIYRMVKVV